MLHRVDIRKRVCDMIHGPPVPSLQSCLDDMEIPWALSSGEFSEIRKLADFMNLRHTSQIFLYY